MEYTYFMDSFVVIFNIFFALTLISACTFSYPEHGGDFLLDILVTTYETTKAINRREKSNQLHGSVLFQ